MRWVGGDQGPLYAIQKCNLWCIAIWRRVLKINFFSKYSVGREGGGGGAQRNRPTLCKN